MGLAYGYTRKSTTDEQRQKNSHEVQRTTIQQWANGRAVEFVQENGSGRRNAKLPERDSLLLRLSEGDTLVVAKLDRLARSVIEGAQIIERMRRLNVDVVILDLGVDTTTATGEMIANVVLSIAQFESRQMGERISDTMQHLKTEEGRAFGRPRLIPRRTRDKILHLHAAGLGKHAIATKLNDERVPTSGGGKQWYPGTVQRVLDQERAA